MSAYGLAQSTNTGSAVDAWQYSFTEPDPLGSVVELNRAGTVRSRCTPIMMIMYIFAAAIPSGRCRYSDWTAGYLGSWVSPLLTPSGRMLTPSYASNAVYLELQNVRAHSTFIIPISK